MAQPSPTTTAPAPTTPVAAAFFDVDRTLLAGSSLLAMIRPLRRAGLVSTSTMITSVLRQLWFAKAGFADGSIDRASNQAVLAVRGQQAETYAQLGRELVPEVLMPRLFPAARAEIERQRRAGRRIYLVSSAPIEIVRVLGELLGADGVAATVAEVGPDGCYTGSLTRFCSGQGKATAVAELAQRDGLDLAASYAFGDSLGDRFMLQSVGHPVATNADRRLRRLARVLGWSEATFEPAQRTRSGRRGPAVSGESVGLA